MTSRFALLLFLMSFAGCRSVHRNMYGTEERASLKDLHSDLRVSITSVKLVKAGKHLRAPTFENSRLAGQNLHECLYTVSHSDNEPSYEIGPFGYVYGAICSLIFAPVTAAMIPWDLITIPFRWDTRVDLAVNGTVNSITGEPLTQGIIESRLGYQERVGLSHFGGRGRNLRIYSTKIDQTGAFSIPVQVDLGSARAFYYTLDLLIDTNFYRRLYINEEQGELVWKFMAPPGSLNRIKL
jgi:hypothetical protein